MSPTRKRLVKVIVWYFQIPYMNKPEIRDGPICSVLAVYLSPTNDPLPHDPWMLHSSSALVYLLFLRLSGNRYTYCDTLIHLNFLQITLAAIVFTIPLLPLVKDGTGPMHVLFLGFCMWRLLVRIFDIARSLEERIPLGERIKSASEVDITRIESGLE